MGKVVCKICGYESDKGIKSHLKSTHGMNAKSYRSIYPGAQVLSDKELQRLVSHNKSGKMRDLISDRNRDPEFIKKCQEGAVRSGVREIQSNTMRRISKQCWKDEEYRKARSETAKATQQRLSKDPEVHRRRSELFKKLWKDPNYARVMHESYHKSPYGVKSWYHSDRFQRDYYCQSQGEREFLEAVDNISEFIRLDTGWNYPISYISNSDDCSHTYIPDFLVSTPQCSYLVEIKYDSDSIDMYRDKVIAAIEYCKLHDYKYCYVKRFEGITLLKQYKSLDPLVVTDI